MYVQTTAAMLKKPTKSIEQQRLDALKYAEKLWGPNIGKLSPSPSPSKVLSPSPPLPLSHNSSNSSSVKETTVPTRSSHITPPLPPHPPAAAAMRIDRKREASTSPSTHTSLEARTTGAPLQESKKPRYGSNSLSSSSSSSSYHRAEDTHNSIGDVRSQKVHSTPHNSKRTPVESSNSTSSSNLTATAVDPLVAAREQMKKLNEERARAAGIAAAARLDKRGTGRK